MNCPTSPRGASRGNRRHASLRLAANGAGFAALLFLASCAHEKAWRVTGEGLVTLQATYIATGRAIDAAHDKGLMTDAEYRKWAAFARYFAPTYDIAADRWLHGDDTATEHAAAVLAALSAELATWAAKGGVQ